MIKIRKSKDRGYYNHRWLETYHTFSFADFYDPDYESFRTLRVINEDYVMPGEGFAAHSHSDMEIITFILKGALEHKDSMGNTSIIRPGEIQRMTAGTGVTHSEFNPSQTEKVHLLQIWILPDKTGLVPSYEQKAIDPKKAIDRFALIAAPTARDGSVKIHQDAFVYMGNLKKRKDINFKPATGRGVWVQVITGGLLLNGRELNTGDGASVTDEKRIEVVGNREADFLLFDLK